MMKKHSFGGKCAAAFGLGMIIAFICPAEWLVAILAIILMIMGIFCFRQEETHMQIVVVKSPKFLKGVLKLIFGIKKEHNE